MKLSATIAAFLPEDAARHVDITSLDDECRTGEGGGVPGIGSDPAGVPAPGTFGFVPAGGCPGIPGEVVGFFPNFAASYASDVAAACFCDAVSIGAPVAAEYTTSASGTKLEMNGTFAATGMTAPWATPQSFLASFQSKPPSMSRPFNYPSQLTSLNAGACCAASSAAWNADS